MILVDGMKRHLRFFSTAILLLISCELAFINWKLSSEPETRIIENDTVNYDLLCQLRYLRDAMANRADHEMQDIYPEGYVFFNCLYGLSWAEFASSLRNKSSILFQEAHVEIQRAYNNVSSEHARSSFDESLPLAYGAFYRGWSTYLLAKKLKAEPVHERDSAETRALQKECEEIALVLNLTTYPASYYGSSWPADVFVCAAALALHDQVLPSKYTTTLSSWLGRVKKLRDTSGLIPHSVHSTNGTPIEYSRGSSLGLIICFLQEIDPSFADALFPAYHLTFFDSQLGLSAVREFAPGVTGKSDIDSGPIILEMGGAATIMGLRVTSLRADQHEEQLRSVIESLAFPVNRKGKKKYFLGKMPMADVFIAWAHAGAEGKNSKPAHKSWRIKFQLISSLIVAVSITLILVMWREKIHVKFRSPWPLKTLFKKTR